MMEERSGSSTLADVVPAKIKRKRGVRNAFSYKCNLVKNARVKGEAYTNYAGKEIAKKHCPSFSDNICCSNKCFDVFDEGELAALFNQFYSKQTKDEQDSFLQDLIEVVPVSRKRHKANTPENKRKPKSCTVHYMLLKSCLRKKVCKEAFIKAFQVSKKRVQRISELSRLCKTPVDKRGKKTPSFIIKSESLAKVHSHISSFLTNVSHCTGNDVTYLNRKLNVKMMHSMFKEIHPTEKISYQFYWQYFKENFSPIFEKQFIFEELNIYAVESLCLCAAR